jgi:hypothetical protein
MSDNMVEPDRLSLLAQLHSIESDALGRSPEYQAKFFSATRKGRFTIMMSILDQDSVETYQALVSSLETLKFSVAA